MRLVACASCSSTFEPSLSAGVFFSRTAAMYQPPGSRVASAVPLFIRWDSGVTSTDPHGIILVRRVSRTGGLRPAITCYDVANRRTAIVGETGERADTQADTMFASPDFRAEVRHADWSANRPI